MFGDFDYVHTLRKIGIDSKVNSPLCTASFNISLNRWERVFNSHVFAGFNRWMQSTVQLRPRPNVLTSGVRDVAKHLKFGGGGEGVEGFYLKFEFQG